MNGGGRETTGWAIQPSAQSDIKRVALLVSVSVDIVMILLLQCGVLSEKKGFSMKGMPGLL